MTEQQLALKLEGIVKAQSDWREDFGGLTVHQESRFTELQYSDSGVGEDCVAQALRKEWPDRVIEVDTSGGCDSCGYGRSISITISGTTPPWEVQS